MALNSTPSKLDPHQILQRSFDGDNDRLRVDTAATITAGQMEIAISHTEDSVKIGDGTDLLAINADGSINIGLPTGASTATLQTSGNSTLTNIDSKLPALSSGRIVIDGSQVTQPISVVSLPLPSGAATSALQNTTNTSLSSIDTKLTRRGILTDRSGLATATSTQIMDTNSLRNYMFIQNISSGTIWFNFTATADVNNVSIRLSPGDIFIMEDSFASTEAVNIIREGSSDLKFIAKEG